MKILVISDTHGKTDNVIEILNKVKDIDRIIHLGDYEKDAEYIQYAQEQPVDYISGNCDYGTLTPNEKTIILGPFRLFLTHGHLYRVKENYDLIRKIAKEKQSQIVLFGHTHVPYIEVSEQLSIMNPGSLSEPRSGQPRSYGILQLGDDKLPIMTIHSLEHR